MLKRFFKVTIDVRCLFVTAFTQDEHLRHGWENLVISHALCFCDNDKNREAHMCQLKKQFIFKLKNQRKNLN